MTLTPSARTWKARWKIRVSATLVHQIACHADGKSGDEEEKNP